MSKGKGSEAVSEYRYDTFVCHASEDKDTIARPLATRLTSLGYRVWFDEISLTVGDSLRAKIDTGLRQSRFGIVILSVGFFSRNWPRYELDGLSAREMDSGEKVILPIWHGINKSQVAQHSWALSERVALVTTLPLNDIVSKLSEVLGPAPLPLNDIPRVTASDLSDICPHCSQKAEIFGFDGGEGDSFAWIECPRCGFFKPIEG